MSSLLGVGPLSLVWSGMIAAIAMEARVKFNTPSLTRAVALDVGRTVFSAFNRVETGVCLSGWALMAYRRPSRGAMAAFGVATAAHVVQVVALAPSLFRHATMIAEKTGGTMSTRSNHILYVVLEGVKIASLLTCAALSL